MLYLSFIITWSWIIENMLRFVKFFKIIYVSFYSTVKSFDLGHHSWRTPSLYFCQIILAFYRYHERIFFFLFQFIYFNWKLITFQYCSGFCCTLTWISHGFTCVPHPEPPSHLPPHPIPLSHPSAPALSMLSQASNLDWRSVSQMIIYMFQCYSLRSFHPCLLPQSLKDCSIHLCLFCCLAYRVIITIFLNSI